MTSRTTQTDKKSGGASAAEEQQPMRLWLNDKDREEVFEEAAAGATDAGIPYWIVLLLAGAIASLGLSLNSAAVVIGAMLIAPLLAPIIGFALALAVGDGRLAVRTALVIAASTLGVIVVAAILSKALPFHTLTDQISARTRPTMLDLAIAAFSGLAGAVVTVARGKRLAGTVPGVAVSVALVPPLAVTGYGIGSGWNWEIIRGSLLLYAANLAGIVMSAMALFLLVGMHHKQLVALAEKWHRDAELGRGWGWLDRIPGLRSLGILASPWARVTLVLAFVALIAIPLDASLRQIAREARVRHAIEVAEKPFNASGRSFIVSQNIEIGDNATQVSLDVATTSWFADSLRTDFEKHASRLAHEAVTLVLEQLPASTGDVASFASMLGPRSDTHAAVAQPTPAVTAAVVDVRGSLDRTVNSLVLPDSVAILDYDMVISEAGSPSTLHLVYLAPDSLATQVLQLLAHQLRTMLKMPALALSATRIPVEIILGKIDNRPVLDSVAKLAVRYPHLRVEILPDSSAGKTAGASVAASLLSVAHDSARVVVLAPVTGEGALKSRLPAAHGARAASHAITLRLTTTGAATRPSAR